MAITYVEIEDRYKPKTTDQPIEVSVAIGDGQTGGYLIFLEQKLKGANRTTRIGKPNEVLGKRVIVSATVVDELDETNWTSVTVIVREGDHETRYGPYSKEAAQNLDTISFIVKIVATNAL